MLNEAKERYKKATQILKDNTDIANGQELIQSIVKKVVLLNQEINKINEALSKPEVSDEKQELIKNLFSGGQGDNDAQRDLEGVMRTSAKVFDEFIVDDFLCTGDQSAESDAARQGRSWSQYRRDLLTELSGG